MTALVEQLHYTWAARGVEGSNRFQIAAISPGLRSGPARDAMPMLRRLCRYDPPRGARDERPVSFGWLDYEAHRIAFRRIGLPAVMGKQGNFAAHLLVAPVEDLPEASIAALFGSSFWWDGVVAEDADLELPPVAIDQVPTEAGQPGAEDLQKGVALAYHVFTMSEDTRLAVTASAEEVGRAVRSLARISPEALAGLSFSTYEGQRVFPFDLLGVATSEPGMDSCTLVLPEDLDDRGLSTLSQMTEGRALASAAGRVARREGGPRAASIWQAARRIVGLSNGEETAGSEELFGDAGVVGFICGTAEGRAGVAAAVQSGGPAVLDAVSTATAGMSEDEARALAAAIAARYRESRSVAGCAAVGAALGTGSARETMVDAVLDLVRADEDVAATLLDEDAAAILASAAGRGVTAAELRGLLRGARGRIEACAREPRVPEGYLAAMFEFGLEGVATPQQLALAARERPQLLAEVQVDGADVDRCLRLLQRADLSGRQVLLPAFLYPLAEEPWGSRLAPIVQSLPPRIAALAVLEADRDAGNAPPEALGPIREDLAARLLAGEEVALTLQLLEVDRSPAGRSASRMIRAAGGNAQSSAAVAVDAGAELGDSPLGEAIARFAINQAASMVERPVDVAALWSALTATGPDGDQAETEALRRLLEIAGRRSRGYAAAEILGWIARSKAVESPKLITRLGGLRDDEADKLALELATRVPVLALEEMEESIEPAGRGVRRWWKRLRKSAERQDPPGTA